MKENKFKRSLIIIGTGIILIVVLIFLAFKFSPWPSALLIRQAFNKTGKKVNEQLIKYIPSGVSVIADQQYIDGDDNAKLDVYYPTAASGTTAALPVIVWVHGGGWIAGSKDQLSSYCSILASKGFCVVAINYSLAPEKSYPTPLIETNKALAYISKNSRRFYADPSRFILAGDSGGAHIAAQTANIISDSSYAKLVGIAPQIQRKQLSGLVLYCGPYDAAIADKKGPFGNFLEIVLWSYSGKRDYANVPGFKFASITGYLSSNYPPCFVSAGNGDPLLPQSRALVNKLNQLNVKVDSLFFRSDTSPALLHEYQFNLDGAAGKLALERSVKFLKTVTSKKQSAPSFAQMFTQH